VTIFQRHTNIKQPYLMVPTGNFFSAVEK